MFLNSAISHKTNSNIVKCVMESEDFHLENRTIKNIFKEETLGNLV